MVRLHLAGGIPADERRFDGMLFKTPHRLELRDLDSLSHMGWHIAVVVGKLTNGKHLCQCQCGYEFQLTSIDVLAKVQGLPSLVPTPNGQPCCDNPLPFVSFRHSDDYTGEGHGHHIVRTLWVAGCGCGTIHTVEEHRYEDDER